MFVTTETNNSTRLGGVLQPNWAMILVRSAMGSAVAPDLAAPARFAGSVVSVAVVVASVAVVGQLLAAL